MSVFRFSVQTCTSSASSRVIQQILVRFASRRMLAVLSTVALCFLVPPAPSMRVHTAPASLRVAPLSMAEAAGAEELCDIMPASVCEEVCHSKPHAVDHAPGWG
jgi:hypothetical protein